MAKFVVVSRGVVRGMCVCLGWVRSVAMGCEREAFLELCQRVMLFSSLHQKY